MPENCNGFGKVRASLEKRLVFWLKHSQLLGRLCTARATYYIGFSERDSRWC